MKNDGMTDTKAKKIVNLAPHENHIMSEEVEKVWDHNFNYSPHSFLHTSTHLLKAQASAKRKKKYYGQNLVFNQRFQNSHI